jgi:hypothetical protein
MGLHGLLQGQLYLLFLSLHIISMSMAKSESLFCFFFLASWYREPRLFRPHIVISIFPKSFLCLNACLVSHVHKYRTKLQKRNWKPAFLIKDAISSLCTILSLLPSLLPAICFISGDRMSSYHCRLRHVLPGKRKRSFQGRILWSHVGHAVTFQHFLNLLFSGSAGCNRLEFNGKINF